MTNPTFFGRRQHSGFTLIELLVVVAIIAVLAAILFPVFARAREKARQTACLTSQKQIVASILIYAQDHDEELPSQESVWQDINVDKGSLVCQSAPKGMSNAYAYVSALSGLALGQINTPQDVYMIGDGDKQTTGSPNTIEGLEDWDYRHDGGIIIGYVDGHAVLTKEPLAPFPMLAREGLFWWLRADTNYATTKVGVNTQTWVPYINNTGIPSICTTGNITGLAPRATNAMAGYTAVRFDGTKMLYDYGGLNVPATDHTVVISFRPTDVNAGTLIVMRGFTALRLRNGKIQIGSYKANTDTSITYIDGPAVSANKIHYVVASWSPTGGVSLYLDKVVEDSVTVDASLSGVPNIPTSINTIADADWSKVVDRYKGDIGEILLYNRVLDASSLDLLDRYMTNKYNIKL